MAVLKIADYTAPDVFVVPVGAIQKSLDGEFVYVAAEEKGRSIAQRKSVQSGKTYNGMTEIKSGLAEGDKVITTGYQNVVEGDIVRM